MSIECELHVSNPLQVSASIHRRESSYHPYPEEHPHKEKQLTPTNKERSSYLVHTKEQLVTMQTQLIISYHPHTEKRAVVTYPHTHKHIPITPKEEQTEKNKHITYTQKNNYLC